MPFKETLRRAWYSFLQLLAQVLFPALFVYRSYGRDNVPPSGGALIVSNHQSYMDPLFIGVGLPRQINIMAREDLFRKSLFFGWLILSLNAFPVKKGGQGSAAIREAVRRLREGRLVVIFPEGTRTFDGCIGELHKGIGIIAHRAGVPVVPCVIHGAFEVWPRFKKIFRFFKPVEVAFGRPIYFDSSSENPNQLLVKEVRERMIELQRSFKEKKG